MTPVFKQLLNDALALPDAERAWLADELLASLTPTDPKSDEVLIREIEARFAAFEAKETEAIPVEDVFCRD